jgi:hypothetical protein
MEGNIYIYIIYIYEKIQRCRERQIEKQIERKRKKDKKREKWRDSKA